MAKLTDKEIIEALESGKRIRRKSWMGRYFLNLGKYGTIIDHHKDAVFIEVEHLTADDWEVVE